MNHDPHAVFALLLHLGCPENELSRVYAHIAGRTVPVDNWDPAGTLLNYLRSAMVACGLAPEPPR